MSTADAQERLEERLLQPIIHTSRAWFIWTFFLVGLVAVGMGAYVAQLRGGLAVTGMGDTVVWGFYISNFVFFSGVGMAGTFISGILRMTGAEWRRPLTRFSELTTVAALTMCAIMPAVDMGRPDRLWHILRYGRLESPLIWDVMVIPTYLTASILYLYLFLIPDSAFLRDRLGTTVSRGRQRLYSALALGWQGLPEQRKRLNLSGNIMMVMIIPIAVATHSVVSWIFGLTYRSGWDSTIFAPYFVVGALYSGTAMLITLMYIFRRLYRLEEYLTLRHFRLLATLLVVFGLTYIYFTFAEYLTVGYKLENADNALLQQLFFGRYALLVWFGFIGGQLLPVALAAIPRTRTLEILFVASVLANVGMWIKRVVIVVPSLGEPLLPYGWGVYTPSLVEILITLGSFAGFALIITVFAKFFPIISIEEMAEGWEHTAERPQVAPSQMPGSLANQPGGWEVMNAQRNRASILAVLLVTVLAFAMLPHPVTVSAADEPVKITVKVTDGGFDPSVIEVEQGKSIELTFVWANVADPSEEHIMVIPGYKLETDKIDSGHRESTVKFIAAQAGTFDFKCDLECATHDALQNGVIKVKPSSGGATAALESSRLVFDPVQGVVIKGGTVSLSAALQDKDGKPIPKAEVRFYVEQQFLGETGLVEIGVAKTTPNGYANLLYHPTTNVARTVVAKFSGVGLYAASEQRIPLVGSDQFLPRQTSAPDDTLHGFKGGARVGLVVVIAGVWLAFGFMLYQALGIRRGRAEVK